MIQLLELTGTNLKVAIVTALLDQKEDMLTMNEIRVEK